MTGANGPTDCVICVLCVLQPKEAVEMVLSTESLGGSPRTVDSQLFSGHLEVGIERGHHGVENHTLLRLPL